MDANPINSPYQEMFAALDAHLQKAQTLPTDQYHAACLALTTDAVQTILLHWKTHGVAGRQEAVLFYRELYPAVLSHWLFHTEVIGLESNRPLGTATDAITHYRAQLLILQTKHVSYQLLRPILLGADPITDDLFTAGTPLNYSHLPFIGLLSPQLPQSLLTYAKAHLLAIERIATYLIDALDALQSLPTKKDQSPGILQWTQTKVALAELLYALQEYGVFGTKPEMSKVVAYFNEVFDIELGNVYKMYENMRLRKKDRTPFLNGLRLALERRMEHDDLHAL